VTQKTTLDSLIRYSSDGQGICHEGMCAECTFVPRALKIDLLYFRPLPKREGMRIALIRSLM